MKITNGMLAGVLLLIISGAAAADEKKTAPPRVFLLDAERVAFVRDRIAAGSHDYDAALANLRKDADKALLAGPFSVMQKGVMPPSGDKHDYLSQAIYWWPDPAKPDGLPYINRDGQINPEVKKITDERQMVALIGAVDTLALAFYLTGEEKYAGHAALLLRTWFLDEATRMNPHLNFAQGIPGRNRGRYSGIVDTQDLVKLPDAIGLLAGYKSWAEADQKGMERWLGAYCDWLVESEFGKQEGRAVGNHGAVYAAQVASLALFSGKKAVAVRILEDTGKKRIDDIEPDGRQPHELRRTKAWTYNIKSLQALFWLASLGEKAGVDLWNYQSADGRSLRKALDWLLPFTTGEAPWTYPEINTKPGWKPGGLSTFLRRAAIKYNEPKYEALLAKGYPTFAASRASLQWPPATKAAP